MKRYEMNVDECGQAHADPDDSGEWVKWEDANARVAELELALSGEKANHDCTVADAQKAINKLEEQLHEAELERDEETHRADAAERSLEAADRAGLELAKQLEAAERKVKRCKAVLSRRFTEAGHCPDPAGELCSADELEAALEDK